MAFMSKNQEGHIHRDGHRMGDFNKRTSIGNGKRKRGSFKGRKKYRGQGKRWLLRYVKAPS